MSKEILGRMSCPCCGFADGVRVTPDRNNQPFGFCEECGFQMRIGGSLPRVRAFYKRHPQVKQIGEVEVSQDKPKPAEKQAPKPAEPVEEVKTEAPPAPRHAPIEKPGVLPKQKPAKTGNALLDIMWGAA